MPRLLRLIEFLVTAICALPQSPSHHGTSIAIVRTDRQIVIASDSRVVDGSGRILPDTCKIRSAGKWHFSLNGMASTRGLDIFPVVRKILRHRGDIASRATAIVDSLTPLLSTAVQSDRALREHSIAQGSVLGVAVFGNEKNVLRLVYIKFAVTDSGLVSEERRACPGDCPQDGRAGIFVPSSDAPKFNWNTEPLIAVRDFVQAEIDRHTVDIGPPLQILQINRKGRGKWAEKPDVCRDEK